MTSALSLRAAVRLLAPFGLRAEWKRLGRLPQWLFETPTLAREKGEQAGYPFLLARHSSPLERRPGQVDPSLQAGKVKNVTRAAGLIDGLLVRPHQVFSYHRRVGRPSRLRGFVDGLELRDGKLSSGVGGGCCQISNSLYLLALRSGMRIVERHRHGLDLFPDHDRRVPFGCGATVFYNYLDLRFENPLDAPVLLRLRVEGGALVSEVWAQGDPGWRVEVYEVDHRFFRQGPSWMRENRVRRRFRRPDGSELLDQEV
ncbi:MAG: VanW family protein, partial [Myxococcaceae bacterium]